MHVPSLQRSHILSQSINRIDQQTAVVLLCLCAVLWSTAGILIKLVSWNPMAITGVRSAIAALVVLAYVGRPRFTWSTAQIGGAIAFVSSNLLFVTATKFTTAANATFLQYTAPIYVAIFGIWFLKERVTRLNWITLGVVISGMFLFFLDNLTNQGLTGIVCAIISSMTFAWLILFLRKQKDESPVETILLGNILAALIGVPFMFESMPDRASWVGLILLGVVQLGIPYVLYSMIIKKLKAIEAVLIQMLEPILNPLWVLLIIGEIPGKWALLGGVIVISTVTICGSITAWETEKRSHFFSILSEKCRIAAAGWGQQH